MRLRPVTLVVTFALGLLAGTLSAEAQLAEKMPRIGYLNYRAGPNAGDEAFRQTLRDLGWIEGQNIAI